MLIECGIFGYIFMSLIVDVRCVCLRRKGIGVYVMRFFMVIMLDTYAVIYTQREHSQFNCTQVCARMAIAYYYASTCVVWYYVLRCVMYYIATRVELTRRCGRIHPCNAMHKTAACIKTTFTALWVDLIMNWYAWSIGSYKLPTLQHSCVPFGNIIP
jgi:hypothetical protein